MYWISLFIFFLFLLDGIEAGNRRIRFPKRKTPAPIFKSPQKSKLNRSLAASGDNRKVYNIIMKSPLSDEDITGSGSNRKRYLGKRQRSRGVNRSLRGMLKQQLQEHLDTLTDQIQSVLHEQVVSSELPQQNVSESVNPEVSSSAVIGDSFAGYTAILDDTAVQAVAQTDGIQFIEEDFPLSASSVDSRTWTPWALSRLNIPDGNQGSYGYYDRNFKFAETGKGVTAYILDSGVNGDHLEFSGNKVINKVGTVTANKLNPDDDMGHGTMVAGMLGGNRLGVAPDVKIKSVKVIASAGGSASNIVSGLNWIVGDWTNSSYPASVVNMSVGTLQSISKTIDAAVVSAENSGLFISIAAGNIGIDACTTSPSSSGAGFVVGAISHEKDALTSFSNNGPCVNILAPGESLVLANYKDNSGYEVEDGTSFAAPVVAGIAALYLEKNPKATPKEIKQFIISNSSPVATNIINNTTKLVAYYNPN
ncbi:hypothetical protein BB560_005180 [Smittium megazygosporum]|uniref:Peptidase S8/S53 domain-containing protein n=1 Tax=Smittium megazygosporum TaxID=133381 RepID=A0A2T9Z766_9FUNG|nr:hypothetical protein BB560_005180 [Smittium megazygosporum]